MVFDEGGAAFDPVAVIHVFDAVNVAHLGDMDVAANGAVIVLAPAIGGDMVFEIVDIVEGALGALFQGGRQRPVRGQVKISVIWLLILTLF